MKHIKLYEKHMKYNEGDYVVLNVEEIKRTLKDNEFLPDDIYGKIKFIDEDYRYNVGFFYYRPNESYGVLDNEIERKMTNEEIQIFKEKRKLHKTASKYNL